MERLWCNPILIQNKALASKVILFFHNIVPKEKKRKTRTHDSLHIYPTTAASYKINGTIQKYNLICFSNTETYIESWDQSYLFDLPTQVFYLANCYYILDTASLQHLLFFLRFLSQTLLEYFNQAAFFGYFFTSWDLKHKYSDTFYVFISLFSDI